MTPYYLHLADTFKWDIDQALVDKLKKSNEEKLAALDEKIADAEKNLGESEIREAFLAKAEYLCRIGEKVLLHSH